jgi:hypothetical protein
MIDKFIRKVISYKDFGSITARHRGGLREYRLECGHIAFAGSNKMPVKQKHCMVCENKARLQQIGRRTLVANNPKN